MPDTGVPQRAFFAPGALGLTLKIYTNTVALSLLRNLDNNQVGLARTLQRLSSGLRVSHAADDAAGLAMAARMESQIRGINQGVRNANDAVSAVQTAEAQLAQIADLLQHARELAVQAGNSIYSGADRRSLDREFKQTLEEYDRIAAGSNFNGRNLLNGSLGLMGYQIGANVGDQLSFDWSTNMRRSVQGAVQMVSSSDLRTTNGGFQFSGTYTTNPIGDLDFSVQTTAFRGGSVTTAGTPALDYSGAQNASFTVDDATVNLTSNYASLGALASTVQAQLNTAHSGWYSVSNDGSTITITKTSSATASTDAVSIGAVSGDASAFTSGVSSAGARARTASWAGFNVDGHAVLINANYTGNDGGLVGDIQAQLDAVPNLAGVYQVSGSAAGINISKLGSFAPPSVAGFSGTAASIFAQAAAATMTLRPGDLRIQVGSGPSVGIEGSFGSPVALANAIMSAVPEVYAAVDTTTGILKLLSTQTFTVAGAQAGGGGALGFDSASSQTNGSLSQVNLLNASSAGEVMFRLDATLDTVNQTRSSLGAFQNLLTANIASQQNMSANLVAARGRIMDADYAVELSHLSTHQILRQAGLALLAQAGLQPRNVLALLR